MGYEIYVLILWGLINKPFEMFLFNGELNVGRGEVHVDRHVVLITILFLLKSAQIHFHNGGRHNKNFHT